MFLASPPIPQSRNLIGIQEATYPIPPQEEMEKSRERERERRFDIWMWGWVSNAF